MVNSLWYLPQINLSLYHITVHPWLCLAETGYAFHLLPFSPTLLFGTVLINYEDSRYELTHNGMKIENFSCVALG